MAEWDLRSSLDPPIGRPHSFLEMAGQPPWTGIARYRRRWPTSSVPTAAQLARNQRLLWTWDSLSLALCLRWLVLGPVCPRGGRGSVELALAATAADRFTLDPWPFLAERLEVSCEGQRRQGRFDAEAKLRQALERAPVVRLGITVEAA